MKDFAIWGSGKKVLIMVKEYVERGHAVDAVLDLYCDTPDIDLSCEKFEAAILKIPAADVAPVRHAKWVDNHCTACGMMPMGDEMWKNRDFEPPLFERFMDYCPSCGALMDKEE